VEKFPVKSPPTMFLSWS